MVGHCNVVLCLGHEQVAVKLDFVTVTPVQSSESHCVDLDRAAESSGPRLEKDKDSDLD